MAVAIYRPDLSLNGKLRRRLVRLYRRRPAVGRGARPMVSFTFDDAPESAATVGAAVLERHGVRGTYFISPSLAGQEGHMGRYATRDQIVDASRAGHEIGCHTYSHLDCGQADEPTIARDIMRNRDTLADWGLGTPSTFAYPYGDVSPQAKRVASGRFLVSRSVHKGLVTPGVDLNQAPGVGVQGEQGEATARRWLARAQACNGWLILFTHSVGVRPTEFGASERALDGLVEETLARGFDIVTVAEGGRRLGASL